MDRLHSAGGPLLLAAVAILGVAAVTVLVASRSGNPALEAVGAGWVDRLRAALAILLVAEAAIGAVLFIRGARPAEWLHLVYGVAALAVLPLAGSLAIGRSPTARTAVIAGGALVALILLWRLVSTG